MLHLQRELHCFYFLQVSDCLLSCPDYKIQRFQQLKHGGPNTKGPISTPDLPFTTLYATFKRQTQKATKPLKSCYSNIHSSICRAANCFMNTLQPKGLKKHPFTVYARGEASSTVWQGLTTAEQLCIYPCVQTCTHTQASEFVKEEVYLEVD